MLSVYTGSLTSITSVDLSSEDIDSDNTKLIYTVTQDPKIGSLYLTQNKRKVQVTARGLVKTFTQTDVNQGILYNMHFLQLFRDFLRN